MNVTNLTSDLHQLLQDSEELERTKRQLEKTKLALTRSELQVSKLEEKVAKIRRKDSRMLDPNDEDNLFRSASLLTSMESERSTSRPRDSAKCSPLGTTRDLS